jgi:hypothetical protein
MGSPRAPPARSAVSCKRALRSSGGGAGRDRLVVRFLDATYLPTRPTGAKEGVLVAWGYDEAGERVRLGAVLGQRERYEGWRWAAAFFVGACGRRCWW